jgi:uncharacterized repeat protein (TIGR04138 family)
MKNQPEKSVEQIIREDDRYPFEAVQFVREGLNHTIELFHPEKQSGQRQHVGGKELCKGIRNLAINRWGLMARPVLKSWNITQTRDFGEIVFLLVNSGWMQKEDQDTIKDFENVFDFEEVFVKKFKIKFE